MSSTWRETQLKMAPITEKARTSVWKFASFGMCFDLSNMGACSSYPVGAGGTSWAMSRKAWDHLDLLAIVLGECGPQIYAGRRGRWIRQIRLVCLRALQGHALIMQSRRPIFNVWQFGFFLVENAFDEAA
jgi:hypothetical protein